MKSKIVIFILPPLLIVLLITSGLVYLNTRLLPKSVTAMANRLEEGTGLVFHADSISYFPFTGLKLSQVRLFDAYKESDDPFFTARRMDIDLNILLLLSRGTGAGNLVKSVNIHDPRILLTMDLLSFARDRHNVHQPEGGMKTPDNMSVPADPGTPESSAGTGTDSGEKSVSRVPPEFIRFWNIGSRIIEHRLFPDQLFLYNPSFICTGKIGKTEIFNSPDVFIDRESSPGLLQITAKDERTGLSVSLNFEEKKAEGDFAVAGIDLERLVPLFFSADALPRISGFLDVKSRFLSPVPGLIELEGALMGRNLAVSHQLLGDEAVSGVDLDYDFNLIFDPETPLAPPRILGKATPSNPAIIAAMQESHLRDPSSAWGELRIRRGNLRVNGIAMDFLPAIRGIFPRPSAPARLDLRLHLPETGADAILRAVPDGLSGPFEGMKLAGSLSWDLDLEIPLDMIREMNWRSSVSMEDFAVDSIPAELNVYKLKRSFVHILEDGRNSRKIRVPEPRRVGLQWMLDNSELTERQIYRLQNREKQGAPEPEVSGGEEEAADVPLDRSYRYVYLEDMSRWIPLAVLTCEDGDFFFHDGINWLTFRHAMERNILSGGIEVGASTLTMQLIKNLFLSRDRVLARKIHEAFLVYLLEGNARVSKDRILELYINLVEFGPGIIGIREAAQYYFGKVPGEISAPEAVWLASILPAPRSYHGMFLDGEVPDYWWAHMRGYFDLMLERGRLSEEEYQRAVSRRPRFRNGDAS